MTSMAPSQENGEQQPRRVYFLTSPRTASNLFVRIFNVDGQQNAKANKFYGGYFFMPPYEVRNELDKWDTPVQDLADEDKEKIRVAYQESLDKYKEFLDTTQEEGKIAFVKEHVNLMMKPTLQNELAHGVPQSSIPEPWSISVDKSTDIYSPSNPTIVPDNILKTFQPTFLIRHPAVQMPSLHRVQLRGQGMKEGPGHEAHTRGMYTLTVFRQLYDFYTTHLQSVDPKSRGPLIIDGSDFITHPATIMKYFCDLNGFDFGSCRFNWDLPTQEVLDKLNNMGRSALSTLNASTGVVASKANQEIDIDEEAVKWRAEFGEKAGRELEKLVRDAMPDYNYLFERRLKPEMLEDDVTAEMDVKVNGSAVPAPNSVRVGA